VLEVGSGTKFQLLSFFNIVGPLLGLTKNLGARHLHICYFLPLVPEHGKFFQTSFVSLKSKISNGFSIVALILVATFALLLKMPLHNLSLPRNLKCQQV